MDEYERAIWATDAQEADAEIASAGNHAETAAAFTRCVAIRKLLFMAELASEVRPEETYPV